MICKNCKKEIPDNTKFCIYCGFLNQNKYINVSPYAANNKIEIPIETIDEPKPDNSGVPCPPPATNTPPINQNTNPQPKSPSPASSINKKTLLIFAVFLLILVIGLIGIATSRKNNLKPENGYNQDAETLDNSVITTDNADDTIEITPLATDTPDVAVVLFTMPDVVGKQQDEAVNSLETNGVFVVIEHIQSDDYPDGCVISQSINAGEDIKEGTTILLVIASKEKTIESTDIVGETKHDAVSLLEEQGFNVIIQESFDSNTPAGVVISQHPEGGTSQKPGSDVIILISKGPNTVKMPSVVNKHIDDAEEILSSKDLFVSIEYKKTDSVKVDHVISQGIKKGTTVECGTVVKLVVASGRETIDVADVAGQNRSTADNTLRKQGFDVEIQEEYHSTVKKDCVIRQYPEAGSAQLPDSTITIFVSKGKQPVTITFNATGGTTPISTKTVYLTDTYGSLPKPNRNGYDFVGWYTSTSNGTEITSSTIVSNASNHVLYASWSLKPESGWVSESEVPEGAQILSTRYVYDKTTRETKTSTSRYLSGWTQYDKKTETTYKYVTYYDYVVYGLYHNGDYTYAFSQTEAGIVSHCKKSFNYDPYANCYRITYSSPTKLQDNVKGNYTGCTATSLNGKKTVTVNLTNTVLFSNGTTRKKEVDKKITTYYYERYTTENNLISTTYPSSSSNVTISNVRKQVKYRAK